MTRRKLTTLIVAGALAIATVSIALLMRNEAAVPQTPAAATQEENAEQPADTSPAQIEQVPQRSQDVFMPPASNATGSSPPPPK